MPQKNGALFSKLAAIIVQFKVTGQTSEDEADFEFSHAEVNEELYE